MSFLNRNWLLPSAFALLFVAVPPLLFHFYPIPFWTAGEAEWIAIGNAQTIMTDPRISRDNSGTPLASCEIVIIASKPKKADAK